MKERIPIVAAAAILVGALLLFPPFYGMDTRSSGRIHSYLGHHPCWDPPSAQAVQEALRARANRSTGGPAGRAFRASNVRADACEARVNRVRLMAETVLVLVVATVALVVPRSGGLRRDRLPRKEDGP